MKSIQQNFEALFLAANSAQYNAGMTWYQAAHNIAVCISTQTNVSLRKICGVISALSPNNKWERNIVDCELLVNAFISGLTINDVKVCTFNTNKSKAWDILNGTDPETVITTNKTLNFFLNILTPNEEYVCIDGHMINAGIYGFTRQPLGLKSAEKPIKLTDTTYYIWADIVANLSLKYDMTANQMQAVIWTVYRDLVIERKEREVTE